MSIPRQKMVSEANKDDLMIDILSDLIVADVVKNPKVSISAEESIEMRSRWTRMEEIADTWYELQEAEGKKK